MLSFEVHIPDVREGKAAMNRNPVTYEKYFFFKSVRQERNFLERERPLIYVCIDFPVN